MEATDFYNSPEGQKLALLFWTGVSERYHLLRKLGLRDTFISNVDLSGAPAYAVGEVAIQVQRGLLPGDIASFIIAIRSEPLPQD